MSLMLAGQGDWPIRIPLASDMVVEPVNTNVDMEEHGVIPLCTVSVS